MNPLVSVVVPVYNTEEVYLRQCIESLKAQTLKEIEIILVDDGSTNSCGAICDEYAARDLRIVSLHQENKGVSVARNLGCQRASGKYITFVDSDDWCDDSVLQMVSDIAEKKDAEITLFGGTINRIGRNGKETASEIRLKPEKVLRKEYLLEACCFPRCSEDDFILATCSKLYRRDLLEKESIRFPQGIIYGEDRVFAIKAFYSASSIAFCDEIGYHYRINNQNQATARYMPKLTESLERQIRLMLEFVESNCLGQRCQTLLNTNNIIVLFEPVFSQVFFHPDNPGDYGKRFESFVTYMESTFVREILDAEIYPEYLRKSHKVALWLCRKHVYWPFRLVELKWNIQRKIGCWKLSAYVFW